MHGQDLPRALLSASAPASHVFRVLLHAAALTAFATAGCAVVLSHFTLNITASLPCGVYLLRPYTAPRRGSVVSLDLPPSIRDLVATRRYLPPGTRLVKRIVAVEGDRVCTDGKRYVINGALLSGIADADAADLPLPPPYRFCGVVPGGVAFIAGAGASSLDSRYFGPVPLADLTTAVPLWTSSSP